MYELSLTAFVGHRDFDAACSIIGGLCSMPPWESLHRVLYFQGPPKPNGIANLNSVEKPVRKDTTVLWKELHQSLSRQSFIVQARYDVLKHRDFGNEAPWMDLNNTQGTLRWLDFPDPPHGRPMLTQRKKVELWDQKKLPTVMRENRYQFKVETLEEVYRFHRDDVEFCLWRQRIIRPLEDYVPYGTRAGGEQPRPMLKLPEWESTTPVDLQNRWILQVKLHVLQDNKPDEIKKAQDQLLALRTELDGVFEFRNLDRKVFDTRVALQQQGIQALPQKVTLGKS